MRRSKGFTSKPPHRDFRCDGPILHTKDDRSPLGKALPKRTISIPPYHVDSPGFPLG